MTGAVAVSLGMKQPLGGTDLPLPLGEAPASREGAPERRQFFLPLGVAPASREGALERR